MATLQVEIDATEDAKAIMDQFRVKDERIVNHVRKTLDGSEIELGAFEFRFAFAPEIDDVTVFAAKKYGTNPSVWKAEVKTAREKLLHSLNFWRLVESRVKAGDFSFVPVTLERAQTEIDDAVRRFKRHYPGDQSYLQATPPNEVSDPRDRDRYETGN